MAHSSVLGVMTLTYMPFCFFNIISPIMTLIVAAFGFKINQRTYTSEIEVVENEVQQAVSK